jgi:hypothetical protein
MVRFSRFGWIAFLAMAMLLLSGASSIAYTNNDSDFSADNPLYHDYDCPSSYFSCIPDKSDGYDLRHETDMDRLYREYKEQRWREQMNSHGNQAG